MKVVLLLSVVVTCVSGSGCADGQYCSVNGEPGACVSTTSSCCSNGTLTSGLCPGPSDIQCCTEAGKWGKNPYYYDNWCAAEPYSLRYLDDRLCSKKFPAVFDRDWKCPLIFESASLDGYQEDTTLSETEVDLQTLSDIISNDANVCLIMTRRGSDGKPHHKYLCNGEQSMSEGHETWSSSKIFAMANAAGKLRSECSSAGIDGSTTGKHGLTPLGDLSTIVCSYDTTAGYSSNSLSSYFHDLGWRDRILSLVTGDWLGRGSESLGGNYGESSPTDLGFDITSSESTKCSAVKDSGSPFENTLSTLSATEMTRRILQFQDIPESLRFPNSTWEDMQEIMYGSTTSSLFPGVEWGGMSSDTAIFVQSALDLDEMEELSAGRWRIFSKLGAGYSSSRGVGEIITSAYGCLPVLDSTGNPVINSGYEFTISVRGSVKGDSMLQEVENVVMTAVKETIEALVEGRLA